MTAAIADRRPDSADHPTASARTTPRRGGADRPSLRLLDQAAVRRRARRRQAVVVLVVLLLGALFTVAYVQAGLVAGQQDLDTTRDRIDELEAERARLERAVDEASSPAAITGRAAELGMIRAEDPVYLHPSVGDDSRFVGVAAETDTVPQGGGSG